MALGSREGGEQGGGAGLKIPQGSGAQSPKLSPHVTALAPFGVGAEPGGSRGVQPAGQEEHSRAHGKGDSRGAFHNFCWFWGWQGNIPQFLLVLGWSNKHSVVFLLDLGLPGEHSIVFGSSGVARGRFHPFCRF